MNNVLIKNAVMTGVLGTMDTNLPYEGDTSDFARIQAAAEAFAVTVDDGIPPDVTVNQAHADLIRGFCKNPQVARVLHVDANASETELTVAMLILMYNGMKGLLD